MKILTSYVKISLASILLIAFACSSRNDVITIDDSEGILGETNAPVLVEVNLNKQNLKAGIENRLALIEVSDNNGAEELPVQFSRNEKNTTSKLTMIMPNGKPGIRKFKVINKKMPSSNVMKASENLDKQAIILEGDKEILQYNYHKVFEKDVIRPESNKNPKLVFSKMSSGPYYEEYLKAHPTFPKDTVVTSGIYSIPRSDYIHPLYGLNGEMLTRDWPDGGHPHHRGIFWAWPEVEYKGQRGDLYALQRVFASPAGNIEYESGPVYAEIQAENLWFWEDEKPIVKEHAIIRVYRSISNSRVIDLTISLKAFEDSVTIATRFTDSYGGLNIRMQTPEEQEISYFTDKPDSNPVRAWSDFNGIFEGNKSKSGLMVLQHGKNPEYPGAWQEYPDLAWVQPTFPSPGSRYKLSKKIPLILWYRLIIHNGGKPGDDISKVRWDAYNSKLAPIGIDVKTN
jgi:hypothetical protein